MPKNKKTEQAKPAAPEGARSIVGEVVSDLILALEFSRYVCEHAEGKTKNDRAMLTQAMSVGIQTLAKHQGFMVDFQRPEYWKRVMALADSLPQ